MLIYLQLSVIVLFLIKGAAMSRYENMPKLPGATEEEAKILKTFRKYDIKEGAPISRWLLDRFIAGKPVPDFVRIRIMDFVEKRINFLIETKKKRPRKKF